MSLCHIVGETFKDSDFTSSVDLHEPLSYSRGGIQGLYYMTEAHEGQHWKWNHCPWMSPLLYDRGSMKVYTGSEMTVLECLPYYMTEAHEGQHWKWNHCPWMPPLPIWQRLMKVNTGSEITVLECLTYYMTEAHEGQHWKWNHCPWMAPYYMTEAHEGQHWKWNHCPWMPPLLYDRGSWRSTLEVKSLSLNISPTIWQGLMNVKTGSEITVLGCLPYYMTEAHEGQH